MIEPFIYRARTDAEWTELKSDALKNDFKPGAIVEMNLGWGGPFQLVSYPYFADGVGKLPCILARITPGDPSSMREIPYDALYRTIRHESLD